MLKTKIYNLINKDNKSDISSRVYDWIMLVMILASIVPLMLIKDYPAFHIIEVVTVTAFIIDYMLRWFSSPHNFTKELNHISFIRLRLWL